MYVRSLCNSCIDYIVYGNTPFREQESLFYQERKCVIMASDKKNPPEDFCFEELSDEERLKYEVAMELGLYDQVIEKGWRSLSAKETGKIGGIVSRRRNKEDE